MDAFTLVARLTLNRSEFDASFRDIETDINSDKKKSTFSAWGVAVGNLAAKAFSRAFSAASGFAKSIIATGMDFDSMMSEVKAVGGLTEEEFESVRQKAIDLGASTKFTSKEVGEAFYYMGLAGWDTEEMLSGIEGVLNLAAASGENLGTVSDIVTDAITAMGLSADDTARFVNALAAASTNSNTTVGMMGEAFKYLATTGGVLEYSIEDVATVLGLLANNGIKAGQAGTSMRQILNTLIAPSEDAKDAMEELGLSLFEIGTDKRKPLMQVVTELRDIFKNSGFNLEGMPMEEYIQKVEEYNERYDQAKKELETNGYTTVLGKIVNNQDELDEWYEHILAADAHFNEDFLAKLSAIGGLRGISSLFALMNSTDDDVNQLVQAVNTSSEGNGAAKNMAKTMIDNLEGDITLMNSALDGLKILMSDEYKGALRGFVQVFTEEIGNLANAFEEGGITGMLVNLTDWIINGITDTLSNPEITVEGANKFGQALGDFVGHLISTLVTSAPQLLSGLFTAGLNLADGLVKGLFAGLFGTGEGTVTGLILNAQEEEQDAINQANRTATEAQGIVSYMDSLIEKYGDAASNSGEWATSLERLEQLIPGITGQIKEEGQTLEETTASLRGYIELSKEKAKEDAKRAAIEKYRKEYEEAQVELGEAEINRDIAKYKQEEAARELTGLIAQYVEAQHQREVDYINNNYTGEYREQQLAWLNEDWAENSMRDAQGMFEQFQKGEISFGDLVTWAQSYANELGESHETINTLNQSYKDAEKEYRENQESIKTLTENSQKLAIQLDLAEKAVERMVQEMQPTVTTTTTTYGQWANDYYSRHSHASGTNYVPYDNYMAELHRGEMVLTASQARKYRDEDGSGLDIAALQTAIVSAVHEGLANAQVNAYVDGRKITDEVSRRMNNQFALSR